MLGIGFSTARYLLLQQLPKMVSANIQADLALLNLPSAIFLNKIPEFDL
jgi:hypothetical protein